MAGLLARVSWSSLERCARWDTSPVSGRSARSYPGFNETVRLCTRSSIAGWMRSSLVCMISSLAWARSSPVWMRSSLVVWPSDCQCRSPGFDPRILRHTGIWRAADEAVLNKVHRKKSQKSPCLPIAGFTKKCRLSWLTNSSLVYEPKYGRKGGGGFAGSLTMETK